MLLEDGMKRVTTKVILFRF